MSCFLMDGGIDMKDMERVNFTGILPHLIVNNYNTDSKAGDKVKERVEIIFV